MDGFRIRPKELIWSAGDEIGLTEALNPITERMYLSTRRVLRMQSLRLSGDERVNVLLAVPWLREEQDLVTHSSFGPSLFSTPFTFSPACVCIIQ